MALPRTRPPALLVVAAFSRHAAALAWGRERLERRYGPVALAGEPFAFDHTGHYEASMGRDLVKQLLAFRDPVPLDGLPDAKHHANALEAELAAAGTFAEPRPLNLDPGLLTLAK